MPNKKTAKQPARDSKGNPISLHSKRAETFDTADAGLAKRQGDAVHGSMKKERQPRRRAQK